MPRRKWSGTPGPFSMGRLSVVAFRDGFVRRVLDVVRIVGEDGRQEFVLPDQPLVGVLRLGYRFVDGTPDVRPGRPTLVRPRGGERTGAIPFDAADEPVVDQTGNAREQLPTNGRFDRVAKIRGLRGLGQFVVVVDAGYPRRPPLGCRRPPSMNVRPVAPTGPERPGRPPRPRVRRRRSRRGHRIEVGERRVHR